MPASPPGDRLGSKTGRTVRLWGQWPQRPRDRVSSQERGHCCHISDPCQGTLAIQMRVQAPTPRGGSLFTLWQKHFQEQRQWVGSGTIRATQDRGPQPRACPPPSQPRGSEKQEPEPGPCLSQDTWPSKPDRCSSSPWRWASLRWRTRTCSALPALTRETAPPAGGGGQRGPDTSHQLEDRKAELFLPVSLTPHSALARHHLMSRPLVGCPGPWWAVCSASRALGESAPPSHSWYSACTLALASGARTGMPV